ncbi:hypothetical protein JT24_11820 [Xylella fastidiosa]|nr:hypothetical protein JT24_11820 [Xylella fastidiosa]
MAALDGEGGGFAVTGGADADVTAGVDVGACGGGGGGGGGAVVCAAAKGEGGVEAAQGAGVLAHGINGVFGAQGGGEAGQGVETGVAAASGGVLHLLGGLGTGNQGVAEADGEAALAGGGVLGGVAGVVGLDDVDFFGVDVDVAVRGQDVAADLLVVAARQQGHIAVGGADEGAGGGGGCGGAVGALALVAQGEGGAAVADEAALFGVF